MFQKRKLLVVGALVAVLAFPSSSFALCSTARDMNGVWKGNDGGTYYVRQVGNVIWWLGMSGDGGRTWTNVYKGVRTGSIVTGTWADVPTGRTRGTGVLNLQVEGPATGGVSGFSRREVSGGFGGSWWSQPCSDR